VIGVSVAFDSERAGVLASGVIAFGSGFIGGWYWAEFGFGLVWLDGGSGSAEKGGWRMYPW
jgi:hypothetical protein